LQNLKGKQIELEVKKVMKKMNLTIHTLISWFVILIFVATSVGCAGKAARNPLPLEFTNEASIPGVPEARFWGDEWPKHSLERMETFTDDEIRRRSPGIYKKPHNYMAISGGGANGAFGAGLLAGWTEAGNRPEFTMVTGISTGALTAPFVFLGTDYDDELKEIYTTTTTEKIALNRNFITAVFSDSMADTGPLREMIAHYITSDMIEAIAVEYKKGRRLYIGTANIDAGRAVVWDIGAIAASDYPRKVGLIHDVLRASSAIPVAFPPVMIPVEANGQPYDEMHVDGGTGSQVFVYPAAIDWKVVVEKLKVQGKPRVFVLRNSFLDADYTGVKRSILPIGVRTINSLIRTQGIGDLYQIYVLCMRDGNDFNLAYIPSDFTEEPSEGFDPVYMTKLYDLGYQMAKAGYPWQKYPPGFQVMKVNED
jgi:predicted patatin/cPLA2 family phospholipase